MTKQIFMCYCGTWHTHSPHGPTQKIDQRTSNILVRLESNTDEVGSIDQRIEIMADHIKIMSDLLKQMEQELGLSHEVYQLTKN